MANREDKRREYNIIEEKTREEKTIDYTRRTDKII
jgi:hypothetical protein